MEYLEEISSEDLYSYRKDLANWKSKGPQSTLGLITQLAHLKYTKELLAKTKVMKTVKTILKQFKQVTQVPHFNKDQINSIRLKLHNVYLQMKDVRDEGKQTTTQKPIEQMGDLVFSANQKEDDVRDYRTTTDYLDVEQREKFRDKLSEEMKKVLEHFKSAKNDYMSNFKPEMDFESRINDLAHNIEKRIYQKHLNRAQNSLYRDDFRTLLTYLSKDTTGKVFSQLLNGYFSVSDAVELRLAEWSEQKASIDIQDNDANFYSNIRRYELLQAPGQECSKCKEPYLYLVDERQIRRADEPATKFFECQACGHKFKI